MEQPARQLDDDGQDERKGVYGDSGVEPSDPRPKLRVLEGGGETSEPKEGHLSDVSSDEPSREQLSNAEERVGPDDTEKSLYKSSGAGLYPSVGRFSLRGRLTRRRAIYGGGMLGAIISLLLFLTLSSGPLQFIHIAQKMQAAHFSHQQDAGDGRMGRIYRFAREGGKPGETRLGWLGSKMHKNILADLEKIGIKPVYKGLDIYQGFEVDRSTKGSPFQDMSNAEVTEALKEKGVNVKEITFEGKTAKVTVKGYINQRRSLKFLSDQTSTSKIPGSVRVRVMERYGLVTWHPMKILDKQLNSKLTDLYDKWKSSREERFKTGAEPGTVDATKAGEKDAKGNVTAEPGEKTALPSDKVKNVLGSIKESNSLKVAGGVAFAVGLVCAVRTVNDNIDDIRYIQVITPLIRMGMDAVTTGNQLMSGQDVDSDTVSFLAKNLDEVDSKGNIVSTWDDAAPIQAQQGQKGGIDIDAADKNQPDQQGIKDVLSGQKPDWLTWSDNAAVGKLCSGAGQAVAGTVSVVIGIFSGGLISTVGSTVVGALASGAVIDKLSNLLSGDAVNVAASGAQWGNNVDFGSRLAANTMAAQFGGTALTDVQSAQLNAVQSNQSDTEFRSKSLAYRLFNPYDSRSTISKVVDGSSPSFTQNLNRIGTMFINSGKNLANVSKLFTASAKAAAPIVYDYGFPEYGFSQQDLDNPAVTDPFANADAAAAILDGPKSDKYTQLAKACFGVNIKKIDNDVGNDGSQIWDVVPADEEAQPYGENYQKNNCNQPGDTDWLKVRFFIFDTGIMEGYACYQGDDQSCSNDGFTVNSSPDDTLPTVPSGSTVNLGDVFKNSTSIACAPGTKDLGLQDGYSGGSPVKIRICAVSNIASSSEESNGGFGVKNAAGKLVVNSRVSGAVYAMAQAAKEDGVTLAASSGFRTMAHQTSLYEQNPDPTRVARPGYSNHQMGLAIDFAGLSASPGPVPGNAIWDWLARNAATYGYKNYPAEAWHWSVTGN
jgi:hypothetical protein